MLRRSILELSSCRYVRRIPRQITTQIPSFLSSRKDFSTTSPQNAPRKPGSTGNPAESRGNFSKVFIGSVAVAGAFLVAYQTGYLDQYLGKEQRSLLDSANFSVDNKDVKDEQHLGKKVISHNSEEPIRLSPVAEHSEHKVEAQTDLPHLEALSDTKGENQSHVQEKFDVSPEEGTIPVQEKDSPEDSQSIVASDDQRIHSGISSGGSLEKESPEFTSTQLNEEVTPMHTKASAVPEDNEMKTMPPQLLTAEDKPEDALGKSIEAPSSLLDAYHLREKVDESTEYSLNRKGNGEYKHFPMETEAFVSAIEKLNDGYISKDGKLVLDFLQAIHAAEERQAELDACAFAEEKKALKEKYDKELRDLRARELMRTEESALLDKELKRERTKAAAAVKSLQEKLEEKLRTELEQKENEAELNMKKVQELAKAELTAAIASEKAAQIEKMAEADLHINALCMAFYARSEEARKSHSVHKLALGALALEDSLSKGLPIQKEVDALHTYLEGIDRDSILGLVLSSLPEETRYYGTDTLLQLNQKFDALKGTLRHFSLIPPGGGGILTHSLAHVASWLKVREVDQSGDGIESVINKVSSHLAEGKLAEAADALEQGVRGSQAEEIVSEWVKKARNRAITEQALTFLQSYATCISHT